MDVVLCTPHSSFTGQLAIADKGRFPAGSGSPRLQDIVNNPRMFFAPGGRPSTHLHLHNVLAIYEGVDQEGEPFQIKEILVDPAHVEIIYEITPPNSAVAGKPPVRVGHEQRVAMKQRHRVEILTVGRRRIVGTVMSGFNDLRNPLAAERNFFAIQDVRIHSLSISPAEETVPYLLLNRRYVEAYRADRY